MTCEFISPSTFVREDERIEVFFLDGTSGWYKGRVSSIGHYGKDKHGRYVECEVVYEDGDVIKDTRLYDDDFNTDSPDAWRFSSSLNGVLEALDEARRDIATLKSHPIGNKDDDLSSGYNSTCDGDNDNDSDSDGEGCPYGAIKPVPLSATRVAYAAGLLMVSYSLMKAVYMRYVTLRCEGDYRRCQVFTDFEVLCDVFNRACISIIERVRQ